MDIVFFLAFLRFKLILIILSTVYNEYLTNSVRDLGIFFEHERSLFYNIGRIQFCPWICYFEQFFFT